MPSILSATINDSQNNISNSTAIRMNASSTTRISLVEMLPMVMASSISGSDDERRPPFFPSAFAHDHRSWGIQRGPLLLSDIVRQALEVCHEDNDDDGPGLPAVVSILENTQ